MNSAAGMMEWLKENFTRKEAESHLCHESQPIRSFLVRSSKVAPWLTLSIKLEDSIKHYKIYNDETGFFLIESEKFGSLEDLVSAYSKNNWQGLPKTKENRSIPIRAETCIYDKTAEEESRKPLIPAKSLKVGKSKGTYVNPVSLIQLQQGKISTDEGETNDNNAHYSTPMRPKPVDLESFYSHNITGKTRKDAENYLASKENFTYLLRKCTITGNNGLSLKTENGIRHYVIYSYGPQYYIRCNEKFSSIELLIERYSKNKWKDLLNSEECVDDSPSKNLRLPEKDSATFEYDYSNHYQTVANCGENYMKTFTREEAQKYLSKLSINSYLVRPAIDGLPTLSIKSKNGVLHYKIFRNGCDYYINEHSKFPTIAALINAYSKNNFKDLIDTKPKSELNQPMNTKFIGKQEAVQYLSTKPFYSYVLRDSTSYVGCKSLSVKTPDGVSHYVIYSSEKGFYIFKGEYFSCIIQLISTYSVNQWEQLFAYRQKPGRLQRFFSICSRKFLNATEVVMKNFIDRFSISKRSLTDNDGV